LGSGLSIEPPGGPTETLSTRRYPHPRAGGDPSAARGPSVGPASLRLGVGYGFAIAAATFFGIGGIVAKSAFNAGLAPSILAEWRVLFAFLVFVAVFAAIRPEDLRIRRSDLWLFAVFGIVGLAGVSLVYYEAIKRIPVGVALVIEYTGPVLLLVYARARGRTVGGRLWISAALAIVGCFFAAGAYDARLLELNAVGLALAALAAFIFAVYFALAERLGRRYRTPTLLVWGFGFALLGWSIARPPWLLPWTTTSADVYVQIAAVVVVATLIPFALTLAAVRIIPAARVGLTATFEPVVAAVAAWIALGERLELPQVAGGVVVLLAIGLAQSQRPTGGSV
jgi:drug/metabolite transporter (DMT)-like permease